MFDKLSEFFNQDPKRQDDYRDFERRYREDPNSISDEEAARRYRELMANMEDDDEVDAQEEYEQVFARMTPEERRALARRYQEATRDPNRRYAGYRDDYDDERATSPRELARMTRRASKEDPDLLESLLGPNNPLNSTGGRAALAGLAALAARKYLGGRRR
jgi:hypothetical protein